MRKRVEIRNKILIESSILLTNSKIGILMDRYMQRDLKDLQGIRPKINSVLGFSLNSISKRKEIILNSFIKL